MAVEATHLKFFPPQLIQDRDLGMNSCIHGNAGGSAAYKAQQMRFSGIPGFATTLPTNHQSFCQPAVCDSAQAKTSINTDSGLTYNIPAPRKRSRDSINQLYATPNFPMPQKNSNVSQFPSLVGDDILPQIQQYQSEIDTIISQHTKRIRLELEQRQKQYARLLVAAIGEGVSKKLKEKEDQIQRMGKLNFVLQERVKSLYVENQLWRDMAQTNEATANSLRSDLEQVLAHVGGDERVSDGAAAEEDVESCCGSNDHGIRGDVETGVAQNREAEGSSYYSDRRCKRCGERESSVLVLPCRHLCLCNVCGSGSHQLQACPACNCSMNATLHVNMSD